MNGSQDATAPSKNEEKKEAATCHESQLPLFALDSEWGQKRFKIQHKHEVRKGFSG